METRETILVAMSGGVDSSVAAALLQERGHRIIGAFLRNGVAAPEGGRRGGQGCCSVEDARDARRVADALDIPFYVLDLAEGFSALIDDFVAEYAAGRTPNPCIECNRRFKMGASAVATGHYARVVHRDGRWGIARGLDPDKDQSYVLYPLSQDALAGTRLPLGEWTKPAVREEARRRGLPVAEKPESMEICFVPTGDYRDLLAERRPELFRPGPIVDGGGRILGTHPGTAGFTIGQRRGLPGGQREPLYVTRIDPVTDTVMVGPASELRSHSFTLEDVVWSGAAPHPPGSRLDGALKVRHQHRPVSGHVIVTASGITCHLDEPVAAVTPGQSAVLYAGDQVLLGGIIQGADGIPV